MWVFLRVVLVFLGDIWAAAAMRHVHFLWSAEPLSWLVLPVESCCTSKIVAFFEMQVISVASLPFPWSLAAELCTVSCGRRSLAAAAAHLPSVPSEVSLLLCTSRDMSRRANSIKCPHICTVDYLWWWWWPVYPLCEGYKESRRLRQVKVIWVDN